MAKSEEVHVCSRCAPLSFQINKPLFCDSCHAQIAAARTNKTYTIPSTGHTYAYFHYPPFPGSNKPTLLFLHGFPSTSYEWRHQLAHFISKGYGLLIPDLLGSGGTSKPLDVRHYIGRSMASEIVAILDHEGLDGTEGSEVVGVSHDWGTYLLSQLIVWFDERFVKYVFFSVPHTLPGRKTDLVAFNRVMKEKYGYELYGYQFFLSESRRAGKALGENWETFFNMIYPNDPSLWKTHMAPTGAMEAFLNTHTPTSSSKYRAAWSTDEDKTRHHEAFGDSYEACLKWYERGTDSLGVEEEKAELAKGAIRNGGRIKRETLMITGLRDAVCGAERARGVMGSVVAKGMLKVVDVDAGHWIMQEKTEETNAILEDFLENGVGGSPANVAKL